MQRSFVTKVILNAILGPFRSGLMQVLHKTCLLFMISSISFSNPLVSLIALSMSFFLLFTMLTFSFLQESKTGIKLITTFSINGGKPIELYDHQGEISYTVSYNNYADAPINWLYDIKYLKLHYDSTVTNLDGSNTYIKYWLPLDKHERFAKIMQNNISDVVKMAKDSDIK